MNRLKLGRHNYIYVLGTTSLWYNNNVTIIFKNYLNSFFNEMTCLEFHQGTFY